MDTLKYYFCLWLIIAPAIQANPTNTPSVEVSSEQLNIAAGGSGSVTCVASGNPLPRVQWRKHDDKFGPGTSVTGNTMTINDAHDTDGGYYVCMGFLGATVVAQKYVYVDIENAGQPSPGNVKLTVSQRTLSIPEGGTGSIECTPEGNPLLTVQWTKSDGEFRDGIIPSGNTLIISDARKEDSGNYVCQGIVDGTVILTSYSAVEIEDVDSSTTEEVKEPVWEADQETPTVTVSEQELNIPEGGSGSIVCTPGGNPLPRVQWIKSNSEFRDGVRQSENALIISDARKEDRGYYVCQGVVDGTVVTSAYVAVEVADVDPSPPSDLKVSVSQRTLLIPQGGRGTIECRPEGNPMPTVHWIKSEGEFRDGISQSGNTLIISDARQEDRGHYVCQGIVDGTVMANDYTSVEIGSNPVTAAPVEKPKVELSVRRLKIQTGQSGSVTCNPWGSPLPTITWRKHKGKLGDRTIVSGNTLTIIDAQESDKGYYMCIGMAGNTLVAQQLVYVDIEKESEETSTVPQRKEFKLTVSEQQLIIPEGGSGTIKCTPEGEPLPRVQWVKSNGEFREGVSQSGNTLIISDARKEDRGHYTCEGIVDGTVILTNYSTVDVEERSSTPPSLPVSPSVAVRERQPKVPLGGSVSIECIPEGYPLPSVQWSKADGEFRDGISQSGNTLVISDARQEDRGHYVCQGIVDGTVMVTDYSALDIEYNEGSSSTPPPPKNPTVTVRERQPRVLLGGSVSIECIPEGNPLPSVQWSKADGEFRDGISQSGNTLVISDARQEDRGHYVCQGIVDGTVMVTDYSALDIENEEGISSTLPPPPPSPEKPTVTVRERQPRVPLGESVSIECIPEGNPLPSVQWSKADGEFRDGISQSGNTLVITNARQEDRGHYVCQGIVDGTVMVSDYSALDIENNEDSRPGHSEPLPNTIDVVIAEGTDNRIGCNFDTGDIQQRVTWIRSDQRPLSQNAQVLGQELVILGATNEDSGDYLCKVTASRGGIILRVTNVKVEVRALPVVSVSVRPSSQTVNRGDRVTIECVVDGDTEITWDRVDGRLSSRVETRGFALYFNGIEVEDAGFYRCSSQNEAGSSSGIAQITVIEPQTQLIVSQQQLIIPRGGSGSIECTPRGNPLPRVQWSKSNGEFRDGVRQNGNTLVITDAREEDRGHYTCEGVVDGTVILTNYSSVDIRDIETPTPSPEHVQLIVSQQQLIIPRGGSGSIECTPRGNPLPRVQWSKSNGEFRYGVRQNGNTLVITDAREEDRGHYTCEGVVDGTVILTNYSSVDIRDIETPTPSPEHVQLIVSQQQLIIPRGGSGSIECTPRGNPLPRVQWSKSNGEFRYGVRQNGNTLVITDAREEDRGHYTCEGVVDGTVILTNYSSVDIRDIETPTPSPEHVQLIVSQQQLIIPRGGSGSIECTPRGNPLPRVQWSKSNGAFRYGVRQNGNTLVITDAREEDRGHYTCEGVVDGTVILTNYSSVDIRDIETPTQSPEHVQLIVSQQQLIIPRGGSGSIECTPRGNPLPRVQWSKSNGEFRYGVRQNGNTLVITDAREEDRGHYTCEGVVDGTVILTNYSSVDIRDIETPTPSPEHVQLIVSQQQLIIPRGGSGSIECTPRGNPLPRVQWSKSNGEFRYGVRQNGNTLVITDAREEDRGHYTCEGVVDGTVILTNYSSVDIRDIETPTPSPEHVQLIVSQKQLILPRGGSGSIECTPSGNPLPSVRWSKANGEFRDGVRPSGNTLVISDAREEDRGNYICEGVVDGTVILTNYTSVDITDEQEIPPANLRSSNVVVSHKQVIVPEGGKVSIECTPEGDPLPTIQWVKSNGEFRDGISQSGNSLVISDARQEDRGHYACQGIVDGTLVITDYATVDIKDEELSSIDLGDYRVQIREQSVKIPRGGNRTLECTAQGNPLPTIRWTKHDGEFGVGTRPDGNTLTISAAQEQDGGYYVCDGIVDGTTVWTDYSLVEIENTCELPAETGSCRAYFERWHYDSVQQKCEKFIWGGCGGNKNNFETEEQCSLECESVA